MKNLLVVIDAQNDFIDGALGTPEAQKAVPNIIKKMREYQIVNNGFVKDPDESLCFYPFYRISYNWVAMFSGFSKCDIFSGGNRFRSINILRSTKQKVKEW